MASTIHLMVKYVTAPNIVKRKINPTTSFRLRGRENVSEWTILPLNAKCKQKRERAKKVKAKKTPTLHFNTFLFPRRCPAQSSWSYRKLQEVTWQQHRKGNVGWAMRGCRHWQHGFTSTFSKERTKGSHELGPSWTDGKQNGPSFGLKTSVFLLAV